MKPTTKTFITIVSTFAICLILHFILSIPANEPTEQDQPAIYPTYDVGIKDTIGGYDTAQVITSNTVK